MATFDSFELLYVYIEKLERCFINNEFTFTTEYKISFDSSKKKLNISKIDNKYKGFFGEKIKSINLIVGKNGCGKSTLLDLIGLKKHDRKYAFTKKDNIWFALYKCGNDNEFYIEGENPDLILDKDVIKESSMQSIYSLHFHYDFIGQSFYDLYFSGGSCHNDVPFVLYNRQEIKGKYFNNQKLIDHEEFSVLINREYIQNINLAHIYYLSTFEKKLFQKLENQLLKLKFFINNVDLDEKHEIFEKNFKSKFNYEDYYNLDIPQKFRFNLMKSVIYDLYENVIDNVNVKDDEKKNDNKDSYLKSLENMKSNDIISTINEICKITCDYLDSINGFGNGHSFQYYEIIDLICTKVENIPKEYLYYSINKKENPIFPKIISIDEKLFIEIGLFGEFDKNIFDFINTYELLDNYELSSEVKRLLRVEFGNNISTGEVKFIQTFSGIYYALTNNEKFKDPSIQKLAIILLDEPDESFHPMWISSFVHDLVELVNSIDTSMTYKFIITTHSPFMLSDIPREFISCIKVDNHIRSVEKPKKSFASNYYDIIKDSFFLEYSMGYFAKNKINNIIKSINTLTSDNLNDEVEHIKNAILIVDDDFLRKSLNKKLESKIASIDKKYSLMLRKSAIEDELAKIYKELGEKND